MKIKAVLLSISGIVAAIPGLGALTKMKILPLVWQDINLYMEVTVTLLCAVCVMILYGFRKSFEKMSNRKAAISSGLFLMMFLFSTISFIVLKAHCVFPDPDDDKQEKAFIPISVSPAIKNIINHPEIGSRSAWVSIDGAATVNRIVREEEENSYNIHKSMVIFVAIYLSMFIFLICSMLVYGLHISSIPLEDEKGEKQEV